MLTVIYIVCHVLVKYYLKYMDLIRRPDMAPMIFTKSILESKPINIFNFENMSRDFTYIDDITEAIYKCTKKIFSTIDIDLKA